MGDWVDGVEQGKGRKRWTGGTIYEGKLLLTITSQCAVISYVMLGVVELLYMHLGYGRIHKY